MPRYRLAPPSIAKKLLLFIMVGLLLPGTGCRSADRDAQSGPVRIVFKHSKIFGDPHALASLISQFEAQHPGVRVQDEEIPASAGEQHQLYVINLEGESPVFDVLSVDIIWIAEFAEAGWIVPLTHLFEPEAEGLYFPATLAAARYKGELYAVPWFVDAGLLYYRKDLLEKHGIQPPRRWNDLVRAAQVIGAAEGMYGYVWEGKQSEGLICNALEYMWGKGGEVLQGKEVAVNSPANREALNFMHDLVHRHAVSPGVVTSMTEEGARQLFTAGKAVFIRNWPYMWNILERDGSPLKGKVGISPLPSFEGRASVSTLGGWYLAVNRYSRNRAAAEAFIRFMSLPQAQKELALRAGFQPPRRELYRDEELLRRQPALRQLAQVFGGARPRPVTPFYLQISEILQPELSSVIVGKRSAEQALSEAEKRLRFVLEDTEQIQ